MKDRWSLLWYFSSSYVSNTESFIELHWFSYTFRQFKWKFGLGEILIPLSYKRLAVCFNSNSLAHWETRSLIITKTCFVCSDKSSTYSIQHTPNKNHHGCSGLRGAGDEKLKMKYTQLGKASVKQYGRKKEIRTVPVWIWLRLGILILISG